MPKLFLFPDFWFPRKKNIKINYLEKFQSPKTVEMAENCRFVGQIITFFHNFLLITSKYVKKDHIKKS